MLALERARSSCLGEDECWILALGTERPGRPWKGSLIPVARITNIRVEAYGSGLQIAYLSVDL